MLPVPNLIYVVSLSLLGIGFFLTIFLIMKNEKDLWGKPSIPPFFFYSGKFSMYVCWGLGLLRATIPDFGGMEVPGWMTWTGSILFAVSSALLLISFYDLGSSVRYGLPEKETQLKTTGLYRFSRHPLYMAMFLVLLSAVLFFPHPLTILVAAYCMTTHYFMILREEEFLSGRFGHDWDDYKKRVRRFL